MTEKSTMVCAEMKLVSIRVRRMTDVPLRTVTIGVLCSAIVATTVPAQRVDSLSLRSHVRFLSSDALEGRANGTRGQHAAAEYIVAQFERMGLQPLDSARSFRQVIPLLRVDMRRDSARMILNGPGGLEVVPGIRFYHFAGDSNAFLPFSAPIRYASVFQRGIGDIRGAVVVVERTGGVPLDSLSLEVETAGARALIVLAPDSARYVELRHARGPTRYIVKARTESASDRMIPVLIADPGIGPALSRATTVALEVDVAFESVLAWNLIARLPGVTSAPRDRSIVFTAHYDHIGYSQPRNSDSLYNGFMDNAVGVAGVLGIAEALRSRPLPISALFLLTAVEEEGSFGSAYFVSHPPVPLSSLAAVINLDAGTPLAPAAHWYVEGGDHPVINGAMQVLARQGVRTKTEPLNRYSDHWPFHLRGVPAAFPVAGEGWIGMTTAQEEDAIRKWWRQHRPEDEWDPSFPLSGLRSYAEFAIQLARAVATQPPAPPL